MGVVVNVSVTVAVTAVAVVGASVVTVTAVVVGVGCGDVVGSAKGPHPERLSSMVRQATIVTFLIIDNLRANS
jgi:hypothetical protein